MFDLSEAYCDGYKRPRYFQSLIAQYLRSGSNDDTSH